VPGARVIRGREVVNLVPEEGCTKGEAVVALRRRLALDFAVYVGDDESDEDVFGSGAVEVGVRVAPGDGSAADLSLASQAEVDDLLARLVSRRAVIDGRAPGWERLVRALG
jgi:trehalose 6-phosphate phosphatase